MHAPTAPDHVTQHAPDLIAQFAAVLRARRALIAMAMLLALLSAVIYLRTADYLYEAQLRVSAAPNAASSTPRLRSLSGLAALAGVSEDTEATPFRLYLEDLHSLNTAKALAADPKLMHKIFAEEWTGESWEPKASAADRLNALFLRLSGTQIPAATAPDAARLQRWLASNVRIEEEKSSPVTTLSLRHQDPAFAKSVLEKLNMVADARARTRAIERARANIAHLDKRLAVTAPRDIREALYATRAAEDQRLMLAKNPAAFATQPFGGVTASPRPVSPRQGLVLIAALIMGAAIGAIVALLLGPLRRA